MDLIDNKYIPLPDKFNQKGCILEKIQDFGDGWMVYLKTKENNKFYKHFELVKPKKCEEYELGGNIIKAHISYPSDNSFGFTGFDFGNLQSAINKHEQIVNNKQDKLSIIEDNKSKSPIIYPEGEFTLKDLLLLNKDYNYIGISNEVKKNKNVQIVGERKGSKGKPAKLFKLVK